MSEIVQIDKHAIVSRIDHFNKAWNDKDLGSLSKLLDKEVVYSYPVIKIGFINFPGKVIEGEFKLLKFWKKVFEKFDSIQEDKEIIEIKIDGDAIIVICDAHNHGLQLSCKLIIQLNSELLITNIAFTEVIKYNADEDLSVLSLLIKQFRLRFFSN